MSTQDALTSVFIAENHELAKQSISDSEDMDTSADHAPPIGSSNEEETEDQLEPSSPQHTPRKFVDIQRTVNDRYPGLSRRPSLSVATNTGDSSAHTASLIDHVLPDEEPSSALGKRIFSAQSNPSPPPSPLLSGVHPHIPLVDLDTGSDEPTTPEATISAHELGILNGVSPFASATHLDLNVDFRPHAGPTFMVQNSVDPTANLISFESPVMPATHKSTAYPTIAQTEVLQEPEVGMLGEGQEPTQPSQSASEAAEASTPNMTPRLRRSARLSATPQSTLPPLGQKSGTYRSSPLKHSSIDEEAIAAIAGSLPRPQALKVVKKSTQQGLDPFSLIADSSQGSPTRSAALEPGRTRRKGRIRSTSPMPAIDGQPIVEPTPVMLTDTANSGKRVRRRERGTHIADDSVAPLSPGSAVVLQSMFSDVQPPTNEPLLLSLPAFDSDPTLPLEVTNSSEIQNLETPQRSNSIFPARPNQLAAGSKAVRSPARVPSPIRSQPNLPPSSPMKAMAALEAYPQPPLRRVVPNTDDKAPASSAGNNSHVLPRLGSGSHKLARVVPPKSPQPQPLAIEPVAEPIVPEEEIPLAPVANSSILLPHPVLPSRIPSPSKARLRTPSDSSDGKPASGIKKPGLRQGSNSASRIPRIASKPYARTLSVKKPASDDNTSNIPVKDSTPSIDGHQNGHVALNIQAVDSLMSPPPSSSSLKRKRTDSASVQPITAQMNQMSVITEVTTTETSKSLESLGTIDDKTARATAGSRRVTNKAAYPEYVEVDTEEIPIGTQALVSADPNTIPITTTSTAASYDAPTPEANNVEDIQEPPLRRTARSKRSVVRPSATNTPAPTLPVTGTPRPPPRPRRSAPDTMLFGGMTRTAIEALSQKHTNHNSTYYYAVLETELVKRTGNRPESPGMKIRTIAQRQAEEVERGRSERAERRARRSGDDMEDDVMEDDVLPALDIAPLEHVMGAGEHEPFKTPPKSEPATKRARHDNEENRPCKKGVRWNKSLFTVTYLDEIEVKERKALREGFQGAGCLAPRAKALQLDSLGNLLSVSVPLGNLGNENITVKKFVYEDDEIAQVIIPEPEPVAPPPAKKVTRVRKKT